MEGLDIAGMSADIVSTAMILAGNAKTTATLHLAKTGTYTWATDSNVTSAGQDVTVAGIFYHASQKQAELTGNTAFFLIEGKNAPNIDESDTVEINGVTWQINEVRPVPGGAVFILGLRK